MFHGNQSFLLTIANLTSPFSIELKSHGNVPEPSVRFDFHVARVDARPQRMRNNAVAIVVSREDLGRNNNFSRIFFSAKEC